MPFIGVIAKESDSNFIKNEVLKNTCKNKFEFITINRNNIENLKNVRFETIVITQNIEEFLTKSSYLKEMLKNSKYLIVDSDIMKNTSSFFCENLITYGLNRDAIITVSSIKNEDILICVQKKFLNINEGIIEEQELNVEIAKNNLKKICNSMAVFAILVIYGENLKKI